MQSLKNPPWLEKKLVEPEHLKSVVESLRKRGKTIATLNGSFDLLHAGHLYILHQASLQADCLIVALNTDESIRRYKSPKRPIVELQHRLEMVAALEFVDYVVSFDETDPCKLLRQIVPDVHVNGAEYGSECLEAQTVADLGSRLHLVDRIPTLATSNLIQKIRQCV